MPRNFSLGSLRVPELREPRVFMRLLLGVLLLGNLVALYMLLFPPGGSLEEQERRFVMLGQESKGQERNLQLVKTLAAKVQESRVAGERFFATYFMERRKAASTIVSELVNLAKQAGIRPKEHSFLLEPVEGTADLSMMTVNGAYEGNYADLIHFVNRVDRSPRFLIIESLTAAPQQTPGLLNISVRFHVFVREVPGT